MPYSFPDRIPRVAMHWSESEQRKCTAAAQAVLESGGSESAAIYACIRAAGKSTRKGGDGMADMGKVFFVEGHLVTLRDLAKAWVWKREYDRNTGGGVDRDKLKASDFVFGDERKFPVVTPGDVKDAVSSWGRYKGPHTIEEFRRRLIALCRRKGESFVSQLPKAWEVDKSSPTANDVHVPTTEDEDEEDKEVEKSAAVVDILKADDSKHLVYGAVLVPGKVDSQGDLITEDEVEKAAHSYLGRKVTDRTRTATLDYQHEMEVPPEWGTVVESYVTQDVAKFGESELPKGTWIAVVHLASDQLWNLVKKGVIRGFSIRGMGKRKKIDQS